MVNNTGNVERKHNGRYNAFSDDCGAWQCNSHTCNYPYLLMDNGQPKRIFHQKSTNKYCNERKQSGRRVYEEIEPQPPAESIVTLTRYYSALKADASYRRRITWMTTAGGEMSTVAVVEYLGNHVAGAAHGNCRDPAVTDAYIRTPAETMDAVNQLTKQMTAKAAYTTLTQDMDVLDAPRDLHAVHSIKSRATKAARQNGGGTCANFADEWLSVYNLMATDSFIRFVGALRTRVPNVILYDDRQTRELKAFCCVDQMGSVLSFDKTFNLAAIYVRPSVYKNTAVCRKRTGDNPLFLGPVFLHGHSDRLNYGLFFSHLALLLLDCNQQALTLGSDDELALRQCMQAFFPRASLVSCTRHLQENVGR